MIQTRIYSQKDPRWSSKKLGSSRYTIGTHGCTITSIACLLSVFGYDVTPLEVNSRLKAVDGFAYDINGQKALVIWQKVSQAFPKARFIWRGLNYSNLQVAKYIYLKSIPVLVEVNASKIGATRHWVLYVGDRKLVDPWGGVIRDTSFYPPTGYSIYDKA